MLTHIRICNFAIIDEIELALDTGLTVLTGETGAGKSILVDALGLALGDRADAAAVRHGEQRAEITVTVDIHANPLLRQWLTEQMLDNDDDECLIRRVISAEGRSRAFINGQQVPLSSLRAFGALLVDIHGQHEHQSLLRPDVQRRLLDHHGGLTELAERTATAYAQWQQLCAALTAATDSATDRAARLELLNYQINELEALDLAPGEVAALEHEHVRLSHSERLASGVQTALEALYEADDSAHQRVAQQLRQLHGLMELDAALAPACALLQEAEIQLAEAAAQLRGYGDMADADPQRVQRVQQRLASIRELARKHRVDDQSLHEVLPALCAERDGMEHSAAQLQQLNAELERCQQAYFQLAEALSDARAAAADPLAAQVSAAMHQLGMPAARLQVAVTRLPPERARASGIDQVELQVAVNPGQPPRTLARVASGGELSRIALAIQVVAADERSAPCMVFDEVDAGVGGGVAEIVGRKLRELGRGRQVLCVTHLPQVASQAHQHLRVSKSNDGLTTRTTVTALGERLKVEELARMLGGVEITERTRAHAAEMLVRTDDAR